MRCFSRTAAVSRVKGVLALACLMGLPAASTSQELQRDGRDFTITVDVELVQLPIAIVDRDGAPVLGLELEHFEVLEDGEPQQISLFRQEDVPVSIGLVIDSSGSMRDKRERVNSAALVFVGESNPDDETFVVTFNDEAYLEQDFTGSIGRLVDTLENIDTRGETALNDAIYLGLDWVEENGRLDKKALLVVTDGEDNRSAYGDNPVLERLKAANVSVYIIGLLELNDTRGGLFRRSPSSRARRTLREFAEATGGEAYFPETLDEVEEICRRVAHDLRNLYTIGYYPTNRAFDGTWREVEVKVNPPRGFPRVEVRTKPGYYAPGATLSDSGQ